MSEKGWRITAGFAGILSLVAVFLFMFRMLVGKIDFWTILFFSLIVVGAVAYALIHMILKIRRLTPRKESVTGQVSETKEFVGLFMSILVVFACAIGFGFFSKEAAGEAAGTVLFGATLITIIAKIYDIWRLTNAKQRRQKMVAHDPIWPLSQAEKIGCGLFLIGALGMWLWAPLIAISYVGLLIFLIKPIRHRVEGRWIDVLLMGINLVMVILSTLLVVFK